MTPSDYMRKAFRALAAARLLVANAEVEGACNRAYYAMFDAAHAALLAPVDVLLPHADEASDRVDTVVQPDILVVRDPSKITETHVRGAPDWVIEVLSPATARHDHIVKRRLYERAGAREYWLVHPTDGIVTIYQREDGHFGAPEIAEMAGERAPGILPEVVIRWQEVLDKLPEAPGA